MREQTILSYQNLINKIFYIILNNYNKDFEEDYFHERIIALTLTYDTYKENCDVKFIPYFSRCIRNRYKDKFLKKSFNEKPLDLQIKDDLYLFPLEKKRFLIC